MSGALTVSGATTIKAGPYSSIPSGFPGMLYVDTTNTILRVCVTTGVWRALNYIPLSVGPWWTPLISNGGSTSSTSLLSIASTSGPLSTLLNGTFKCANSGAQSNYISGSFTSDGTKFLTINGFTTTGSMPYTIACGTGGTFSITNNDSGPNYLIITFYSV